MTKMCLYSPARHFGKSATLEKLIAEYVKRNPQAVVARVSVNGTRIEKPVEGEVVGLDLLPAPLDAAGESAGEKK